MPKINLKTLKIQAKKEIEKAGNLKELNEVFNKYLGKRGELTGILHSLEKLTKAKRMKIGKEANLLKDFLRTKLDEKTEVIKKKTKKSSEEAEWIDITRPGKKPILGHLHPLTQLKRQVEEIFQSMGFSVVEGPDMENEWYNFDALNIPKEHPARDQWDTFYLRNGSSTKRTSFSSSTAEASAEVKMKESSSTSLPSTEAWLLRTHTSPVQVRFMEKNNPPLRIIIPGNVFRHEATDPSHEFQHFQVEGLMVDKKVSVANFKAIIEEFFRRLFKKEIKFRLRPDFFPFTEPSFDIAISCLMCGGKGCPACKQSGWMEVAGAGMVHPNVFKNSGLNPKHWQGWAFGFGLERLAMLKYKINDIRLFRSGDLRFLQQF